MIKITPTVSLSESEIKLTFIKSPGPGGQNVNKLATSVQLRFNVHTSALPENIRGRLLTLIGNQLTKQGELIIKATRHRTQERNKHDAINRLKLLLKQAAIIPKKRKKTRPTKAAKEKRLTEKKVGSEKKKLRGKVFS